MIKLGCAILAYFLASFAVFAAGPTGIGAVAANMMQPVGFMSDFVYTGCIVIGASFLFASIIKYIEHKRSPLMVPISTVVFFIVAGILLLFLPFLSCFTGSGMHYSLHFK